MKNLPKSIFRRLLWWLVNKKNSIAIIPAAICQITSTQHLVFCHTEFWLTSCPRQAWNVVGKIFITIIPALVNVYLLYNSSDTSGQAPKPFSHLTPWYALELATFNFNHVLPLAVPHLPCLVSPATFTSCRRRPRSTQHHHIHVIPNRNCVTRTYYDTAPLT